MEKGSLHHWLHRRDNVGPELLNWPRRLAIAIDVAKGLNYMHHERGEAPIIHGDIKPENILLDPEFNAKIYDFGLARMLVVPGDSYEPHLQGTFGYMPPESSYGRANEKVDVYSFGVVLLQLTTGKAAIHESQSSDIAVQDYQSLAGWASRLSNLSDDIIDNNIRDPAHSSDILAVFKLGVSCTSEYPRNRPTMKDV
uniref:Protein kinase domain-containing protein n=1 Tax=Hordeum vulgare subsp. vulgare TaxID=112509 RepID=A0A8I6WPY5_HORVV